MHIIKVTKLDLSKFLQKYDGIAKSGFLNANNNNTDKPNSFLAFKECDVDKCNTKTSRTCKKPIIESAVVIMNWHDIFNPDTKLFGPVYIGKSENSTIHFPSPCLSHNHGYFYWNPSQGLTYMDSKSENGTKLNNEYTYGEAELKSGDIIVFGKLEALLLNPESAFKELIKQ